MPIDVLRRDFLKGRRHRWGDRRLQLRRHFARRPTRSAERRQARDPRAPRQQLDLYFRRTTVKGVSVAAPPRTDFRKSLHNVSKLCSKPRCLSTAPTR
jgi:hypothetical protein